MKKLIIFIAIILPTVVFSQAFGGSATYKLKLAFDEDALKVDKKHGLLQQALDVSDKMEYQLIFNKNESNFFQVKNENLDKSSVNMANILSNVSQLIYQNLEKKMVLNEVFPFPILLQENEVIIKDTIVSNWQISTESKLIDNYVCFKATSEKRIIMKDNIAIEKAVAWFCPTLPFSFGPATYGGLPGLILELREKNVMFVLKSLNPNSEKIVVIKVPTAKKYVSKTEYHNLINNRRETLMEMAKQK